MIQHVNIILPSKHLWISDQANLRNSYIGEGYILWIFVAVEVDIALICASAPALKPLFKRYFKGTTTVDTVDSHQGYRRQPSRTQARSVDVEAGRRFPERVELHRVEIPKSLPSHIEKALPPEPWARDGHVLKKEDSESEEFLVFVNMTSRITG
jgi:hypothetical protein